MKDLFRPLHFCNFSILVHCINLFLFNFFTAKFVCFGTVVTFSNYIIHSHTLNFLICCICVTHVQSNKYNFSFHIIQPVTDIVIEVGQPIRMFLVHTLLCQRSNMAACTRRTRQMLGLLRILRNFPQNERMLLCFIFPITNTIIDGKNRKEH